MINCTTCDHDQRDHTTDGCSECECLGFVAQTVIAIAEISKRGGIDLDKPGGITMVPLGEAMRAVGKAIAETEQTHAAELHALRLMVWQGWARVAMYRDAMDSLLTEERDG